MISRRILAALALLCIFIAPAHAQKTKAALIIEINTNWPDNVAGAITPAILRSTVIDILNSYYDLGGSSSALCAAHQWISSLPTLSTITCAQPAIADISGWGTGVAAALGLNIGSAGAPVLFNGAGGTPSSLVLTSAAGLPISTGLSGVGSGVLAAMANSTNATGGLLVFNGAFGTPTQLTLSSATGLPLSTGIIGQLPIANNCPGSSGASSSTFLRGDCQWATPSGAGNVSGPVSSTIGDIATYSNTSGTGIHDSGILATNLPVLLATVSGSGVATLSDLTHITSTYPMYEIVFENIIPATNTNTIELLVHKSGDPAGTFQTSGYIAKNISPNGTAILNTNSTTFIALTGADVANSIGFSGRVRVYNPSASSIHQWEGAGAYWNSSGASIPVQFSGVWNTSAVIDGLEIAALSGNISGSLKIYAYP